jgi:hypothetical protein
MVMRRDARNIAGAVGLPTQVWAILDAVNLPVT